MGDSKNPKKQSKTEIAEIFNVSEDNVEEEEDRYIIKHSQINSAVRPVRKIDANVIEDNITFIDCEIIYIYFLTFKGNVDFSKSKFTEKVNNYDVIKINQLSGITFEKGVNFGEQEFKNINLSSTTFKEEVDFSKCKFNGMCKLSSITFEKRVNFSGMTFKHIDLSRSIFKDNVNFSKCTFNRTNQPIFEIYLSFEESKCKAISNNSNKKPKIINLSHSVFKGDVDFSKCIFGEKDSKNTLDLSSIIFEKNAKFDEAEFNAFTAFHTTSFQGTASFYKTEFNIMPNFSPGDFQGILNLNLATFSENKNDFEYKEIENLIEKAYPDEEKSKKMSKEEKEYKNAINIKDSFRGFKHKLIEQNNMLEAQKFHKAELYCKEIELEKKGKLGKLDKLSLKEKVEKKLLWLYRNTSDHHTNFIQILNFTISVIVCFGIILCSLFNLNFIDSLYVLYLENNRIFLYLLIIYISCIITLIYYLMQCKIILYIAFIIIFMTNPTIIVPIFNIQDSKSQIQYLEKELANMSEEDLINKANILLKNESTINAIEANILLKNENIKNNKNAIEAKEIIRQNIKFYDKDNNDNIIKLINAHKLDKFANLFLNIIYVLFYIVMILCIFSLQKTARKNSIIPQ